MSEFSIKQRLKSFVYAFNGLLLVVKEEHNARIHLIAAIIVISGGWFLTISTLEWITIILVITMVIAFEIVNSAIENLADVVSPEHHPIIKKVKDLAAAAVLLSAIAAVIIGVIIFLPKIIERC